MRRAFAAWALLWAGCLAAAAPPPTQADEQVIEKLLAQVAAQADVQFVRKGEAYDAATAVKFLRGKWDRQREDVNTVRDFIDKIATKSSTTGQPYLIKFKDGHTVECRDYLLGLLKAP